MTEYMPLDQGASLTEIRQNLRREMWQTLLRELKGNYRHQGLPALTRCLVGTQKIFSGKPFPGQPAGLYVLSFTILLEVIALWERSISLSLGDLPKQIIIGDGSGNYRPEGDSQSRVLPIYNFSHGTKLDTFVSQVCASDLVLISDDDIFWTDAAPVTSALDCFDQDPKLAVVSFHPRPHLIPQLRGVISEAMGSYAILIRRDIWLKENLSFQIYKADDWKQIGNYFDVADYANLLLVQRGYHVISAPEELRQTLIPFYGTSMWTLKILASKGDINRVVYAYRPDEHKKAYRTALALLGFRELLAQLEIRGVKPLVPEDYLRRTLEEASKALNQQTREAVDGDIQGKLALLSKRLLKNKS